LVKVLQKFDEVDAEVKSTHRLADSVIWGETISRVLGYNKNEFLEAWELNTGTQQLTVIHGNSFAVLVIKYTFNKRIEKEFGIEPDELLKALKDFASEIGVDYSADKQLPRNAVWLTRKLNMIKSDLNIAGLEIDETKSNERMIWIKKRWRNSSHLRVFRREYVSLSTIRHHRMLVIPLFSL